MDFTRIFWDGLPGFTGNKQRLKWITTWNALLENQSVNEDI